MSNIAPEGLKGEVVSYPHQVLEGDRLFAVDTSTYPPGFLATVAVGALTRFESGPRYLPVTVTYGDQELEPRQAYMLVDSATITLHDFGGAQGDGVGVIMPPQLNGVRFYRRTDRQD